MLRKLNNIYYFVRTHGIMSFLIAVGILIVLSAIFRVLTPPTPQIPLQSTALTNIDKSKSTFQKVSYSGSAIVVPSSFTIGKIAEQGINTTLFSQTLSQKYSLQKVPDVDGMWRSSTGYLDVSPTTKEITFYQDILSSQSDPVFTDDSAIEFAKKQLATFFPNVLVSPVTTSIKYLQNEEHEAIVSREVADFAEVPFSFVIQGYPVYFKNSDKIPYRITVTRLGEIRSFKVFPLLGQISLLGKKNSISIDRSLKNIEAGQAAVISYSQTQASKVSLSTLSNVDLKTAEIQYRVDDTTQLVYPFYAFTGTAQSADGQQLNINLITPAVETGK